MFPSSSSVLDRSPAAAPAGAARRALSPAQPEPVQRPAGRRLRRAFNVAVAFVTLDAVWLGEDAAAPSTEPPGHPHRRAAATPAHARRRGAVAPREYVCTAQTERSAPAKR